MKKPNTTQILWAVYFALLAVLLPHTAWMFRQFESDQNQLFADIVSYVGAFAFEAAIAVLTHKLAKRIEETPRRYNAEPRRKFVYQYLNAISFGLVVATLVSAMANLAHAVQFGQVIKIFADWGIPQGVYSVAFGGILPLVSLTFARVLSNVVDDEELPNPELETARQTIAALRKQVHDTEARVKDIEQEVRAAKDQARIAEERFGALGDLISRIFNEDKRTRILAVHEWKPKLSGSAIALIADSSPAYVSEVLSETMSVGE